MTLKSSFILLFTVVLAVLGPVLGQLLDHLPEHNGLLRSGLEFIRDARAGNEAMATLADAYGEEDGGTFSPCGMFNPCKGEHLSCVGPPLARYCMPMKCLTEAMDREFKEQHLDQFADIILEQAGVNVSTMFNSTILDMGEEVAMSEQNAPLLLNPGVGERIQTAIRNYPLDWDRLHGVTTECLLSHMSERHLQIAGQPWIYIGLQVEVALAFKFIFQFLYSTAVDISTDPVMAANWYNLCFGGGAVGIAHTSFVVGWVFGAQNLTEVAQTSVMFDLDAALGVAIGQAMGFTTDVCYFKLDLTLGLGLGAGIAASGCFINAYNEFI